MPSRIFMKPRGVWFITQVKMRNRIFRGEPLQIFLQFANSKILGSLNLQPARERTFSWVGRESATDAGACAAEALW